MMNRLASIVFGLAAATVAAGCAPEVGSERWCETMRETPRGDWSTNNALDFARHCVLSEGE